MYQLDWKFFYFLFKLLYWCFRLVYRGLNPEDTLRALRIFAEDKGYFDPAKHLHTIQQVKAFKRYVFTCNSMKDKGLCKCNNGFCKAWFYLKLDFPEDFL